MRYIGDEVEYLLLLDETTKNVGVNEKHYRSFSRGKQDDGKFRA
jgi:hypothetical protein